MKSYLLVGGHFDKMYTCVPHLSEEFDVPVGIWKLAIPSESPVIPPTNFTDVYKENKTYEEETYIKQEIRGQYKTFYIYVIEGMGIDEALQSIIGAKE